MSLLADGRTRGATAGATRVDRKPFAHPIEGEDGDPVGDGQIDAELAAPPPPEPVLPNPQPDVPPSPLDDEPGEGPEEPGEKRARAALALP